MHTHIYTLFLAFIFWKSSVDEYCTNKRQDIAFFFFFFFLFCLYCNISWQSRSHFIGWFLLSRSAELQWYLYCWPSDILPLRLVCIFTHTILRGTLLQKQKKIDNYWKETAIGFHESEYFKYLWFFFFFLSFIKSLPIIFLCIYVNFWIHWIHLLGKLDAYTYICLSKLLSAFSPSFVPHV